MNPKSTTYTLALLAALALPAGAFAQTAAPAPTTPTAPAPTIPAAPAPTTSAAPAPTTGMQTTTPAPRGRAAHHRDIAARVERRITQLHAELHITSAEEPQWNSFAQVMRDNARHMRQAFEARGAKLASMNAAENMQSYAQISEEHAQDMQKLAAAFQSLYDSMSAGQKHAADRLFYGRLGHHGRHAGSRSRG